MSAFFMHSRVACSVCASAPVTPAGRQVTARSRRHLCMIRRLEQCPAPAAVRAGRVQPIGTRQLGKDHTVHPAGHTAEGSWFRSSVSSERARC
jgi:hypothetical protein